jgi:hypothetical protein
VNRRSLLTTAIIAVSLVVAACAQSGFRTHDGSCMLAPVTGRLEARGADTYIVTGDTFVTGESVVYAVSWPPGYSAVSAGSGELSVRDASGREVARTGAEIHLTGGGTSDGEWQVSACGGVP